ncbi:MAG: SET domain-containing protein-lysine N-methyltransferase [Proteobacteria bacterium]|nr:SET domain-containing protein-lysine N-methyltransferase [Pseudomonadota bacterium]
MPLLDGLRVVHSGIHGYGVIATRAFRAGEVLCFGDGVLYPEDAEFDDTYALILPKDDAAPDGEQVFWDLACQTRWINHTCDPNTEIMSRWDAEQQRPVVWWVALRDIPIGEEITYDYGFTAEVAEPCACGKSVCRGVIVDDSPEEMARLAEPMRRLLRVRVAS